MKKQNDDLAKSLKNAINEGKAEYKKKQDEIDAKNRAEQERRARWEVEGKAAAVAWVKNSLPKEIKKEAARGRNFIEISGYINGVKADYIADACQGILELSVKSTFCKGSSAYEDMYDSEDRWEYTISW